MVQPQRPSPAARLPMQPGPLQAAAAQLRPPHVPTASAPPHLQQQQPFPRGAYTGAGLSPLHGFPAAASAQVHGLPGGSGQLAPRLQGQNLGGFNLAAIQQLAAMQAPSQGAHCKTTCPEVQ